MRDRFDRHARLPGRAAGSPTACKASWPRPMPTGSTGSSPTTAPTTRRCWRGAGLRDRALHASCTRARSGGGSSRARNIALDARRLRLTPPSSMPTTASSRKSSSGRSRRSTHTHRLDPRSTTSTTEYRTCASSATAPTASCCAGRLQMDVNFSMDSMIAWDRRKTDARYDPTSQHDRPRFPDAALPHGAGGCHLGTPLHDYVKLPVSMSNGPGVTERMIGSRRDPAPAGRRPLPDGRSRGREGIATFLAHLAQGRGDVPGGARGQPGAAVRGHIEPLLRCAQRAGLTALPLSGGRSCLHAALLPRPSESPAARPASGTRGSPPPPRARIAASSASPASSPAAR